MKKYFFFQPIILLICILLFSCSKEKVLMQPSADNTLSGRNSADRVIARGSVTGYILPERASVKITVYNRDFTSISYYYTKDGRFRFDGLPEGIFTIMVLNTETATTTEIPSVKVKYGMITDIGNITVQ